MNYQNALKAIDPIKALKHLKINYLCQGAYVRFKCECGSESAAFKAFGNKKGLWFCPECKKGGNVINFTMEKRGKEYEDTKKWLLKLSPTAKRITEELKLEYELRYMEAVKLLGLSEEICKELDIGVPKGKSMLAGCLTFLIKNENGVKVAYYGIRLKNQQHVYHKSFNPELYLYGLNGVNDHVIVVNDMVDCVKRIEKGEPAVCNFGLNYLSTTQIALLNGLKKLDLEIEPNLETSRALKAHHRYL